MCTYIYIYIMHYLMYIISNPQTTGETVLVSEEPSLVSTETASRPPTCLSAQLAQKQRTCSECSKQRTCSRCSKRRIYLYVSDYFHLYMNGITKPPPRQNSSGDHLGPNIAKYFKKVLSTKIVHTSGICFENVRKQFQKYI